MFEAREEDALSLQRARLHAKRMGLDPDRVNEVYARIGRVPTFPEIETAAFKLVVKILMGRSG